MTRGGATPPLRLEVLAAPAAVLDDADGAEVLRAWIVGQRLRISVRRGFDAEWTRPTDTPRVFGG